MTFDTLPYRLGVGIVLLNAQDQVFVGRRIDTLSDVWQMPQGGIDEQEAPEKAALRELYEETGISSARILAETRNWHHYDLPDRIIPNMWGGKYRGQKQKWYLMRFSGDESEVKLTLHEPEFSAYRWVDSTQLSDLAAPFKRKLYEDVVKEFFHV